jgi:Tol biopolymer transport system component
MNHVRRPESAIPREEVRRKLLERKCIAFSPDGEWLAFVDVNPNTSYDIWMLHLADRKAQPFLQTTFLEAAPQFSPDGHWLAYVSNESGHYEVYVQPYPGPRRQVSDLNRRRNGTSVESKGRRTVLSEWRQDDGGG